MSVPIADTHLLSRLFRGLTEHTFHAELGVSDPTVVDYVSGLLLRFVSSGAIWLLRGKDGARLDGVTAMLKEADLEWDENRRRECHRQVGDFTLFWTGVYPEAVDRIQARGADRLINYREQGKRSYFLASTCAGDDASVLRRLSVEFDLCAFGLSRIRKEWERQDPDVLRVPEGKTLLGV